MHLIYSTLSLDLHRQGMTLFNPRFYKGPNKDATAVTIRGDWPNIVADYQKLGVPVTVIAGPQPKNEGAIAAAEAELHKAEADLAAAEAQAAT